MSIGPYAATFGGYNAGKYGGTAQGQNLQGSKWDNRTKIAELMSVLQKYKQQQDLFPSVQELNKYTVSEQQYKSDKAKKESEFLDREYVAVKHPETGQPVYIPWKDFDNYASGKSRLRMLPEEIKYKQAQTGTEKKQGLVYDAQAGKYVAETATEDALRQPRINSENAQTFQRASAGEESLAGAGEKQARTQTIEETRPFDVGLVAEKVNTQSAATQENLSNVDVNEAKRIGEYAKAGQEMGLNTRGIMEYMNRVARGEVNENGQVELEPEYFRDTMTESEKRQDDADRQQLLNQANVRNVNARTQVAKAQTAYTQERTKNVGKTGGGAKRNINFDTLNASAFRRRFTGGTSPMTTKYWKAVQMATKNYLKGYPQADRLDPSFWEKAAMDIRRKDSPAHKEIVALVRSGSAPENVAKHFEYLAKALAKANVID